MKDPRESIAIISELVIFLTFARFFQKRSTSST